MRFPGNYISFFKADYTYLLLHTYLISLHIYCTYMLKMQNISFIMQIRILGVTFVVFFLQKTQLFFTMSYNAPLGFQFSLLSNQKIFFFKIPIVFMFKFDDEKKQVNHDYENSCPRLLLYIFYAYYNFRKIPTLFHSSHLLLFLICIFINFKSTSTDLVFSFFIYLIHRQLGIIQNRKYPLFLYLQESHFVLATLLKYIKNF